MTNVAIMGGAGHIARTLALWLPSDWHISLFSDHRQALSDFFIANPPKSSFEILPYELFATKPFDLIINAAGPGDPSRHHELGGEVLDIMDRYDRMALGYLESHRQVGYIFISSGAIYGSKYTQTIDDQTKISFSPNYFQPRDYYALSKLWAEAKHRALKDRRIADVRVFGYFTRHVSLDSGFFLSNVARCLCDETEFKTPPHDFVRDIISPKDLAQLLVLIFEANVPNMMFDAVSAMPVTKFEILDALQREFGLRVKVKNPNKIKCLSQISTNCNASALGYEAECASLDVVRSEMRALMGYSPVKRHRLR